MPKNLNDSTVVTVLFMMASGGRAWGVSPEVHDHLHCLSVLSSRLSSQVTFIYIALLTIQIVSKQLHNIKMGK